jgi:hypothetical protein
MRQALFVILLILVSLTFLLGSWLTLIDWMDAITTGFYRSSYLQTVIEISTLAAYSYLGLRFFRSRLTHM